MTRATHEEVDAALAAPAATPDPTQSGMEALRAAGHEPIKIWGVKGPKGVGGVVSAVFLQASSCTRWTAASSGCFGRGRCDGGPIRRPIQG
jgi:hypothetical protein